jgi:hypothetical protein
MGESTQDGSQPAMPDHRCRGGHEAVVVGELGHLDVVRDLYGVRVNRGAEREDCVQIEAGDCLADTVDQRSLDHASRSY